MAEIESPDDDTLKSLLTTMVEAIPDKHQGAVKIRMTRDKINSSWFESPPARSMTPFLGEYLKYFANKCSCHFGSTLTIVKNMGTNAEELIPVLLTIFMINGYQMSHAVETLNKVNTSWVNLESTKNIIPGIMAGLNTNGIGKSYAIQRIGILGPIAENAAPQLFDIICDVKASIGHREYALEAISKIKPKSEEVKNICQDLILKDSSLKMRAVKILEADYPEIATQELLQQGLNNASNSGEKPYIMGILVLSHAELKNKSSLLSEIIIQQGKLGYERTGAKEVVITAGDSFNDIAYVYASIKSNFTNLGDSDIVPRTYSYDFKSSEGEYGKYYLIFNKPK